jgi:hypothetical protein
LEDAEPNIKTGTMTTGLKPLTMFIAARNIRAILHCCIVESGEIK